MIHLYLRPIKKGDICSEPPDTYILAKCDACYTFPCLNGGSCDSILHNRTFQCHCQPGYHGPRCQYAIDACYGGPCENGGICKVLEAGRFSCHCPAGFEGERCQTDVDECRAHKCQNNATCRDLVNGYSCECGPSYTGQYCEKKIEFCSKEMNPYAFRMLTVAYEEATLDRSNVYRWYKMFSEGREDVNDEERAGRPSTSTTDEKINEVEKMILANRRITVREVAEDLNISIGSCHSIFINDLGMRRVAAKFVQKLLNCDQKQHRMNIANEMLDSVRDDPNLLQRVITDDEAWVYGYDVETKAQSSQWKLPHEPRPKSARQVRSNVKVLQTVFFDCRGVVHHEFFPQGRTVNKEYYLQVMRNLREEIRLKRPDLWKNKNWLLHHDNAPAHTSLLVRDLLAKNNTLMMPQPPYSPDLPPCYFFLFPKLERPMKGRRYATLDEIKTASNCECGPHHTGQNCTQNVDVCATHECQNGGTCLGQAGGSYECECPPGFGGGRCELVPEVAHLYPQTSPCQHHDCLHGECFQPAPGTADYICRYPQRYCPLYLDDYELLWRCHPGFSGPRCEASASVTLRAGSYLEFAGPDFSEEVNVTLTFSTLVNHGVLLYTGGERHLAAELYRGRVRVSLDVGNPPPSTMFSFEEVADGMPHVVQLVLSGKNFTLRVDDGPARTIVNEGHRLYLEDPGSLFVGGVTPEKASVAVRHWQLWNVSSLIGTSFYRQLLTGRCGSGCLSEVALNGVPLDPQRASHRQKVSPGCSDRGGAPCANHLCQRGTCVELGWRQDYECRCERGWSGPFCDQAPTCQREHYRDFHSEANGCKSLRKVKLTRCVGSCGTQCCQAAKTKRRHVRMGCPDGRIYQSHVELVRKCRCADTC
ncbi:SLIT2 [Cordylochernes scorpioides]|uniref:SLIT2 n=1 Tax=Cordylochernes scorpioides TaxID=51811 RepID=A0ABY6LC07_9ARAC|nr:SLIT2 [Cordylochernes scorpioides]